MECDNFDSRSVSFFLRDHLSEFQILQKDRDERWLGKAPLYAKGKSRKWDDHRGWHIPDEDIDWITKNGWVDAPCVCNSYRHNPERNMFFDGRWLQCDHCNMWFG